MILFKWFLEKLITIEIFKIKINELIEDKTVVEVYMKLLSLITIVLISIFKTLLVLSYTLSVSVIMLD